MPLTRFVPTLMADFCKFLYLSKLHLDYLCCAGCHDWMSLYDGTTCSTFKIQTEVKPGCVLVLLLFGISYNCKMCYLLMVFCGTKTWSECNEDLIQSFSSCFLRSVPTDVKMVRFNLFLHNTTVVKVKTIFS